MPIEQNVSPQLPARPRTVEQTFRVWDGPLILLGLILAAGLAIPLTERGWIPQSLTWQLMLTALAEGVVIGIIVWLAQRRKISLKNLLLPPSTRWYVEVFWGLGLAVFLLVAMLLLWFFRIPVTDPLEGLVGQAPLSVRIAFLVLAAVMAPLSEELLYRGVLQSSLVPRLGLLAACLIQAGFFGLMHQRGWVVILSVFLGGIAYGVLVLWRGCLLPSIVTHASLNGLIATWLLALFWLNAHVPAETKSEAQQNPSWWEEPPLLPIPQTDTAAAQHEVALWYFGSRGLQLRKDQIKAFDQVLRRFPENREFGVRSLEGIQEVYLRYLDDPRRAIVAGKQLLKEYPDQQASKARAVLRIAEAYLNLKQPENARPWVERAEAEYPDVREIQDWQLRLKVVLENQDKVKPETQED